LKVILIALNGDHHRLRLHYCYRYNTLFIYVTVIVVLRFYSV
jgi:hypothetical protein